MAPDIIQAFEIVNPGQGYLRTARCETFVNSLLLIVQVAPPPMNMARMGYELLKCGYFCRADSLSVIVKEMIRLGLIKDAPTVGEYGRGGGDVSFSNS